MQKVQTDERDNEWFVLKDVLALGELTDPHLQLAYQTLQDWNGVATTDAVGVSISKG